MNIKKLRNDFPLLSEENQKNRKSKKNMPIYFDNACMSLKPIQVVEAMNQYYTEFPGCAGRSAHSISTKVNDEVYNARNTIKKFINAKRTEEIIFTRNTTEAINLVANSINFKKGDVVIQTDKEHNSNLVPWLIKQKNIGIKREFINSNSDNTFNLDEFEEKLAKLNNKVKLVAMGHTSNLDGTTIPADKIIKIAHKQGALVLLDAAQSAPHHELNVKRLDADFVAFSGHKMLGPSGIGALYGKKEQLEKLNTFIVGGDTVSETTQNSFKLEGLPNKFEAGLQDYAGIIGFGAACKYLNKVGIKNIAKQEFKLNSLMTEELLEFSKLNLIGPKDPKLRGGIFNFMVDEIDPHQIAIMLDQSKNIMIRSGAHCNHSWFNAHKLKGSARASTYFYNTEEEVETFVETLKKIVF